MLILWKFIHWACYQTSNISRTSVGNEIIDHSDVVAVSETKFLEHSPQNRCSLYVLYKILLAQANFPLAQLKMHSHWQAGEH